MFKLKKNEKIDIENVNEMIVIAKFLLKVIVVFVLVMLVSVLISLCMTTGLFTFILNVISLCIPLFIGFFISWLFDPLVTKLKIKGLSRHLGATIAYLLFLSTIFLVFYLVLPMLSAQINELVVTLPNNYQVIGEWIEEFFVKLEEDFAYDFTDVKNGIFSQISSFAKNITEGLPTLIISIVSTFVSGIGNFVFGLVIGFYFLVAFPKIHLNFISVIPYKMRESTDVLITRINTALRHFVTGTLMVTLLVFATSSILFTIAGLEAPLLFGLFCGVTNIIPYIGPYIGGIPAVIVAFSINSTVGIFVLIIIVVVQFIESMFIQPLVMSKAMKLHPVTIVMGLLIMGNFFGIIGMIFATPIISGIKIIFTYINEKINLKDKVLGKEGLIDENNV